MISRLFWRMADPLLLRVRSRLEHLDLVAPSRRRDGLLRSIGVVAPNAVLGATAEMSSVAPRAHLQIGEYSHVRGELRVLTPQARIVIGDHCFVGPETRVWAATSISIGRYVLIAHMVDIIDNNSHSLSAAGRREEANKLFERKVELDFEAVAKSPVTIEDDVWIGAKSIILKGVHIGRGAVIAAGSVITRDVEPFTLVAGNPARVLRNLPQESA